MLNLLYLSSPETKHVGVHILNENIESGCGFCGVR